MEKLSSLQPSFFKNLDLRYKVVIGAVLSFPGATVLVTLGLLRLANSRAWKSASIPAIAKTISERQARSLSKVNTSIPRSATCSEGNPRYGVYLGPILHPMTDSSDLSFPFSLSFLKRFRHKKWHFMSLETSDLYLTVAVLHAGYATKAVSLLHRKKDGCSFVLDETSPLNFGLCSFADSSIDSTKPTEFKYGANHIKISYNGTVWQVQGKVTLKNLANQHEKHACSFSFQVANPKKNDQFSLVYPITPKSAAYTHKAMCLESEGILEFAQTPYYLNSQNVGLDWTCSYAPYLTRWNWLFVSGLTQQGVQFGLNLSNEEHYADRENVMWIEGTALWVGFVTFVLPSNEILEDENDRTAWKIISSKRDSEIAINLVYEPVVKKFSRMNTGIIDSAYLQSLGKVSGTIRQGEIEHTIDAVFAIGERQLCIW